MRTTAAAAAAAAPWKAMMMKQEHKLVLKIQTHPGRIDRSPTT